MGGRGPLPADQRARWQCLAMAYLQIPPVPGRSLDPPPLVVDRVASKIEARSSTAGLGYRAAMRFTLTYAQLLAAGTTYYLFLAVFALTALAFGIASLVGADQLTAAVNEGLDSMFPGIAGQSGLDGSNLQAFGQGTSIVGLLVLLYSGGGAVSAAKVSIHQIYGAPKDSRNFFLARLILTGWLLVLAPIILLSFTPLIVLGFFTGPILSRLGLGVVGEWMLNVGGFGLASLLDFLAIYLILSVLGGIRPSRRSRILGALAGAVGIEVLKEVTSLIVSWSISKPQYGAFAAPITALLLLYLQTLVVYAAAALTAAIAEREGNGHEPPEEPAFDPPAPDAAAALGPQAASGPELAEPAG